MKGAGQVDASRRSRCRPARSTFWRTRLAQQGIAVTDVEPRFGEPAIRFSDPLRSGVRADRDRARRSVAVGRATASSATRRSAGCTASRWSSAHAGDDARADDRACSASRVVGESGQPDPASRSTAAARARPSTSPTMPTRAPAVNGLGTVHHVAMAIGTERRAAATARGADSLRAATSPRSATAATSHRSIFASRAACCSRWRPSSRVHGRRSQSRARPRLKLPPWEEPHRADIEAALAPISS